MKILVIQQKMIGDVLTSSILFEALRNKFPNAELHYLIHSNTFPVIENNPFVDKVLLFDPTINYKPKKFTAFLNKVKKEEYDTVIDVYAKINTAIITAFSGAKKKISYYKSYTSGAYTHTVVPKKRMKSKAGLAIENRMLLLKSISDKFPLELKPKIYLTEKEKSSAKAFLIKSGISEEKPLLMISILGSSIEKTYPLPYMAEILDTIVRIRPDSQLLFNYIPSQLREVKQLLDLCSKETRKYIFDDVYGKSLREFIAIASHCDALIGNEGGAVNMAKALNIPTFSIFSPRINRDAWGSYEENLSMVVHLKDYKPHLFEKNYKKQQEELYQYFIPDLFSPKLKVFLELLEK